MNLWASTLILAALASAAEVEILTGDGRTISGSLESLDAQGLTVLVQGAKQTITTEQLAQWKPKTSAAPVSDQRAAWITLRDGSELVASAYRVENGRVTAVLVSGATLKLATRSIRQVRFSEQAGPFTQQWNQIVAGDYDGDVIVVRKEDTLDFVAGACGDITDDTVQFQLDGEKVPVKRPKVEGILYFSAAKETYPPPLCTVLLSGGSRVEAAQATFDQQGLKLTSTGGVELVAPLDQLSRVQYSLQFLSDLTPEVTRARPRFESADSPLRAAYEAFHRPRFNVGFDGGPLRLGQRSFDKGLALYGQSEVVFRLPAGIRQVQGLVGIDDGARPRGDVELIVLGDDRELLRQTIHGRAAPLAIALDVRGAQRLRIVVDGREDEVDDRLILAEMRMQK